MEKDLGKIQKNDTTDIILRIDDFGGRRGLTIREFVTSDRYTGFTKSGVRIMASDFPKFKEMINAVNEVEMQETPEAESSESNQESLPPEQETLTQSENSEETETPKEDLPDY
ncbi:MAG: hypothetical protein ACE5ES_01155 [Candidatus Nanoarchaeia archaeon]